MAEGGDFEFTDVPYEMPPNCGRQTAEDSRPDELDQNIKAYLRELRAAVDVFEFAGPREYLQSIGIEAAAVSLTDVWVMPSVRMAPAASGAPRAAQPLDRVLILAPDPGTQVLLGGPGAGKSTSCRFAVMTTIDGLLTGLDPRQPQHIPLLVSAGRLAVPLADVDESLLVDAALADLEGLGNRRAQVREQLLASLDNVWLIVDGYDEAALGPQRAESEPGVIVERHRVCKVIRDFRMRHRAARVLVTSRESDYFDAPDCSIEDSFKYTLVGFDRPQIELAIDKWHATALLLAERCNAILENWSKRKEGLRHITRWVDEVGELASVPLLLNMLQVVFKIEDQSSLSIAQLAHRAMRFLLVTKPRLRLERREDVPQVDADRLALALDDHGETLLFAGLRNLALVVSFRRLEGKGDSFTKGEILDMLEAADVKGPPSPRERSRAQDLVEVFVPHLARGHGILMQVEPRASTDGAASRGAGRAQKAYRFSHNVFREVLAGQALDGLDSVQLRDLARDQRWHIVIRHWAAWKAAQAQADYRVVFEAGELLAQIPSDDREADASTLLLAAGEMLVELMRPGVQFAGAAQPADLRAKTIVQLTALLDRRSLSFMHRARVGELLGSLGDPRVTELSDNPLHSPGFVPLNGGSGIMFGRNRVHEVSRTKFLRVPAYPQVCGDLDAFLISRHTVTNSQYRRFLMSDPYSKPHLWPGEEAKRWASKDAAFLKELVALVRESSDEHYLTEIQSGRLSVAELDSLAEQLVVRKEPRFWFIPLFNRDNQPVVGVNFWECLAYCGWLQGELRGAGWVQEQHAVYIPSEFEWEYAARRGAADPYPWGSSFSKEPPDAHVRNTDVESLGRPLAVGLFPWASRAGGPLDMVGNVWEWTTSTPVEYSPSVFNAPVVLDGLTERVARGSSYLSREAESPEVTFRSFDPPYNAYEDMGFRVAVRQVYQ